MRFEGDATARAPTIAKAGTTDAGGIRVLPMGRPAA